MNKRAIRHSISPDWLAPQSKQLSKILRAWQAAANPTEHN
jgi:hypothetical protein